jgi:mannobiose 2-epimerase
MKNLTRLFSIGIYVFLTICLLAGCKSTRNNSTYLGVEVTEIETELNSLLQCFYPRVIDTIHGGYWTNFENDWTLSKKQHKMLVTQARDLWTASRAAEFFPDNPVYRKAADHGYQFLTGQMWDTVYGGFFQNYYSDSVQKTDHSFKLTYGNAFALYALSEYARINKDPAVLEWVKKSFYWLENSVHDSVYRGYFNISTPESIAGSDPLPKQAVRRAGWGNPDMKDQNTSIHLMEAFTAAYLVLPEEPVRKRLTEMLELIRDSMVNRDGYLNLYFTKKWEPLTNRDSSRAYILKNPGFDHISFGHNIETAYLLVDASQALYGSPDPVTLTTAKKLTDNTVLHGFDKNYYGLFDKGYMFLPENKVEIIDSTKVWWAQAEAWHALALFSTLYPKETVYPKAFASMWSYIQKEIIDHQYGGWYNSGLDKNPETKTLQKAHAWKACYHDGRALFQVLTYAKQETKSSPEK